MNRRASADEWYMALAVATARRATCARRAVGCVLVDGHGRVVSLGYNGVARGLVHCIDEPCPGALFQSGSGVDLCQSVHAEQNAVVNCVIDTRLVRACYCTTEPCVPCTKLLLNTGCERVSFAEHYTASGASLWRVSRGEAPWTLLAL